MVVPNRVTDDLITWLTGTRLKPVVVLHVNHANELDSAVAAATARLHRAGVALLNQSVLLKDINDNVQDLVLLSERLFQCDVLPYYLHMLDPVTGAAHFQVPEITAVELAARLRQYLPGYLVPRLVREVPGEAAKTPIEPRA